MPQKPVIKGKKVQKAQAANKHGKNERLTVKGKLAKPPKNNAKTVAQYLENKEITKMINEKNEGSFAVKAEHGGGRLKALKAGPPVLAPKKAKPQKPAAEADEDMEEDSQDME